MSPDRLEQIESHYHSALELKGNVRQDYLEKLRLTDPEICLEVESLLSFEEESENFIEESAAEIAAKSLSKDFQTEIIGKKIDSYKVESFIGEGGMGKVFRAVDDKLGRNVALKILTLGEVLDEEYLKRFENEARAASALNHPNILTIYEFGKADEFYFIASEIVEGETLRERMATKNLELAEVLQISIQIAEALNAAHQPGIVHRDIKPENIMIRQDGYIKVLDFGLAKLNENALFAQPKSPSFHTKTGRILGTPNYMSPEQIRGKTVDERSDIFSLGVVIEMLSQTQPFTGNSANAVISSILLDEPKPLPEIPFQLKAIVGKTLEKEKENRSQTMDDLSADLKKLKEQIQFESYNSDSQNSFHFSDKQSYLPNKKLLAAFGLIALIFVVGLGFYFFLNNESEEVRSIAVMPFVHQNADAETAYLADGLTESVIEHLSKFSDFKVMSFNAVSRYKQKQTDANMIGQELGVNAVLFSRLTNIGDEVSINTELVSVRDNSRLWGFQYKGKMSDLLTMQQSISNEIAKKLSLKLSGKEKEIIAKRDPKNAEAFQLYLKGRFFWNKRTGEDLRKAIEFFKQAVEKDSNYALAHAGLADCYGLLSNYTDTPPSETMPQAKAAAQKALEIDDSLAEAHTSLGLVKKEYEWDFAGADKEFQKAIELNPNYATAYQWRAENLVTLKRFDEALVSMNKARELDPFSLIINSEVGWVLHHAERYDEAIKQFQKTAELDPNFVRVQFFFGRSFEQKEMFKEAIESTGKAIELSNGNTLFKASLAHIYATSGEKEKALELLKDLQRRSSDEYVSPFAFALIYAGLDDKENAFRWLEKAYIQKDTILFNYIRDPQLKNLRNEKRFADLLRKVNLKP